MNSDASSVGYIFDVANVETTVMDDECHRIELVHLELTQVAND